MAGETIVVAGTPVTLEANGGSITNNSVVQANDASYNIFTNGASYPDAKFVVSFAFSVAPVEGSSLSLYARPINISSTNDAEVPEAARPTRFIKSFAVNNVTTTQYDEAIVENVPWEAEYYLHNNGTGQTISAGWTLVVIPCSYKAAP